MATLSKAVYRFNVISIKIPMSFLTEIKSILKFTWKHKTTKKAKTSKQKSSSVTIPDFVL
jgi:hypothetical protein